MHLGHIFGLVEILNIALENEPYIFNWVQVRRLRRPRNLVDSFALDEFAANTGSVDWSVVFHEYKVLIGIDLIEEWDQAWLVNVFDEVGGFLLARRNNCQGAFGVAEERSPYHC